MRPARLLLSVLDAKKEVSPLRASLRPMCAPEIGILVVVVAARLALSAGIRGSFATSYVVGAPQRYKRCLLLVAVNVKKC